MSGPVSLRGLTMRHVLATPMVEATVIAPAVMADLSATMLRIPVAEPAAASTLMAEAIRFRPEMLAIHAVLQPQAEDGREQLTVPVCPTPTVTDTVLFEDPKVPETRFYLPRYRVRRVDERELIRLSKAGDAWELSVEVEAFVPPELGDVGAAGPLAHELQLVLHYQVGDGQFDRVLAVTPTPEGHQAGRLALSTVEERNGVYGALTEEAFRTRLIVRRVVTVGVPVPAEMTAQETGTAAVRLIRRDHRMLRAGVRVQARRGVDLAAAVMPDPRVTMPIGAGPPPPRYTAQTVAVDHDERGAFVLPRALYEYVFADVEGGTGEIAFRLHHIPFAGRQHRYYRDPLDPHVFHYLPDAFKLARQPRPPHAPTLLLRFLPGTAGVEDVRAQLDYVAVPYVDPERLRDAAAALPALLGDQPLPDGQAPAFKVLSVAQEKVRLLLALTGGVFGAARESAQVELSTAVRERVELALADFQAVWASMFSSAPVLFQGAVEVTLADGVEQIPFTGRMDDLAGTVLETREVVEADGRLAVTLANRCESPVLVGTPRAVVVTPEGEVACTPAETVEQLALAPGAEATVRFVPAGRIDARTDVLVGFASLEITPDRDALYQSILDRSGPLEFLRTVRVRARHLFTAPSDDPLVAVLVDFERGETAELTPEAPDGEGTVRLPLEDFVLGRMSSADVANAAFSYRVRLVRQRSQVEGEWQTATAEPIYAAAPTGPAPPAEPSSRPVPEPVAPVAEPVAPTPTPGPVA